MGIKIDDDVLQVLERAAFDGNGLQITDQLERPLYEKVSKVLTAMGGKWNRGAKATLFDGDAREIVEQLLDSGEYSRTKQDLGQFFTPAAIVDQMINLAGPLAGLKVLEPSAGEGAIVQAAKAEGADVWAYEIDPKLHAKLYGTYFPNGGCGLGDFLAIEPNPVFDVVLMNPPFAKQADIDHVLHAAKLLKPGGRLVAIMSAGVMFRENSKTSKFRGWVWDNDGSIEPLPENAFAESGTAVRTCIVALEV